MLTGFFSGMCSMQAIATIDCALSGGKSRPSLQAIACSPSIVTDGSAPARERMAPARLAILLSRLFPA
jgi:hypothetical protein